MLWIIVLGIAAGMRAMTPMAALCWFMWLALLPVTHWTFWTANIAAVIVFTLFALGEWYVDTLPQTPSRKSAFPLLARLGLGALVGAIAAASFDEPVAGGIILGVIGMLLGTFGGYRVRMYGAKRIGSDLPVAVAESVLALLLSVVALHFIRIDIADQANHAALKIFSCGSGLFG